MREGGESDVASVCISRAGRSGDEDCGGRHSEELFGFTCGSASAAAGVRDPSVVSPLLMQQKLCFSRGQGDDKSQRIDSPFDRDAKAQLLLPT